MSAYFPSRNHLTWQGQRASHTLMDSTSNLTNGACGDRFIADSTRGTSSNLIQRSQMMKMKPRLRPGSDTQYAEQMRRIAERLSYAELFGE
jgi:hypothetical protein